MPSRWRRCVGAICVRRIKRVDAYIDGRWILLEWEPKLSRGVYRFDDRCEVRGVSHLLKVVAEDAVGNVSTHECSFTR